MAPPLTFTLAGSTPNRRVDATDTAANASLISITSNCAAEMPSRASALVIALAGCACNIESGPATTPCAPISHNQLNPNSRALALLITTTAHAPSEICDDDPAVIVPSGRNAGFNRPNDAAVVSARTPSSSVNSTGSPLRCGTDTATTSSANTPSFHAAAAF